MGKDIITEWHSKRLTDFHIKRIIRAQSYMHDASITAYLSDVFISDGSAAGITYGHTRVDGFGRFADGHVIRTSHIRRAAKIGPFWVLKTMNSRYAIASFKRGVGRPSFQRLLRSAVEDVDGPSPAIH